MFKIMDYDKIEESDFNIKHNEFQSFLKSYYGVQKMGKRKKQMKYEIHIYWFSVIS